VLLVNGDRLATVPGPGGPAGQVLVRRPGSGAVFVLGLGRLRYEIPAEALPFLGRGLSPSLFSVTDLRRAEAGGRLPVTVTFTGRRPALPGITITRSAGGRAAGYLTAASALQFGAALTRQARADQPGARYGDDGLFAGGTGITLAGTPAGTARTADQGPGRPAAVRPGSQLRTLTVTGTGLNGHPDTGTSVLVINAADWHTFQAAGVFRHGTARFSVPAGPYWAVGFFGSPLAPRTDLLPQFTVGHKNVTVHLAARAASSEVTAVTPRPSVLATSSILVIRAGLHHTSSSLVVISPRQWISPTTRRPTVGGLRSYTQLQLDSPAAARGTPYQYFLAPPGSSGIIPPQRQVARAARLATVTSRYYQDKPTTGSVLTFGGTLTQWQNVVGGMELPLPMPGTLTLYLSTGPSVVWDSSYYTSNTTTATGQYGLLAYRPGQRATQDWGQYPLHPQPYTQPLSGAAGRVLWAEPSAFRLGNRLVLLMTAFTDNQAGHSAPQAGLVSGLSGSYALYQNGQRIARGNPFAPSLPGRTGGIFSVLGTTARLTGRPATIRVTVTARRRAALYPHSTTTTTTWTWRTRPQPHARVPATWLCQPANQFPYGEIRTCAVQPMMTLDYHVRGMALNGSTAPGRQQIGLDVGHLQFGGRAPITGATARVSGNDGRTWTPAAVRSDGAGHYTLTFTAAARTDVPLQVFARDAAGGSIAETIHDAYGVR
jgi:hypothetical protein